jgi:hypothetical protein
MWTARFSSTPTMVWEEDVAGGTNAWREVAVDVAGLGVTNLTVAFRLLDKKGVSNFGVRRQVRFCLEAWREGRCDGVVTYCLEKQAGSRVFDLARDLFGKRY